MTTRQQFLKDLRSTLNHLYDPDYLLRSPLTALFGITGRFDAPAALQHILVDAIASLEPSDDEPLGSRAWQVYGPLYYRYVQSLSREQVADQLGISNRQFSRWQRTALGELTDLLWEQLAPENGGGGSAGRTPAQPSRLAAPSVEDELAWLRDAPAGTATDLRETLTAAVRQVQPLAVGQRLAITVDLPQPGPRGTEPSIPDLAVHPVALKQAMLSILSVAIHCAADTPPEPVSTGTCTIVATLSITVRPLREQAAITVTCAPERRSSILLDEQDGARLDMARRLAEICGGTLTVEDTEGFTVTLTLPAYQKISVLAIDDNADTLQLFQRYLSGTRYRLVTTRDPDQALTLAQRTAPHAILLDVMMPQVDGWELLATLREHPRTAGTPIIICTILPQEDLALSMGASAFLPKPVTRQALLAVLAEQLERTAPESH